MTTEFLNYKIDKALWKQNNDHNYKSCTACVDRKRAGCMGGRLGLRHVQLLYVATSAALLAACNQAAATALPQLAGLIPGSQHAPTYDWSGWQCGLFLSSSCVGHALFSGISLRGGRRLLMAALLTAGSFHIALPSIIRTGDWIGACMARAVIGVSAAVVVPTAHELLNLWLPLHERSFIAPLVYYGVPAGAAASLSGCAALAVSAPGWPLSMYLPGAFALGGFTSLLFLTSNTPHSLQAMSEEERDYIVSHNCMQSEIKFKIPWRQAMTSRAAWAATFGQFCCELPHWLLLYIMPLYLTRVLHYSYKQSASLCAVAYAMGWAVAGLRPRRRIQIFGLDLTPSIKFLHMMGALGTAACLCGAALGGAHAASAALLTPVFSTLQAISLVEAQLLISPRFAACCKILRTVAGAMAGMLPLAAFCVLGVTDTNEANGDAWRVVILSCAGAAVVGAIVFLLFGFKELPIWDDALKHYDNQTALELENLKIEKEKITSAC